MRPAARTCGRLALETRYLAKLLDNPAQGVLAIWFDIGSEETLEEAGRHSAKLSHMGK
ncbi:MAG: hypothetical protein WBW41_10735 [Verrucomicrobiia bacterium]